MPSSFDDASGTSSATPPGRGAPPALGELRETVRRAAGEISRLREETHRLRAETERLRERVAQLEQDPGAGRDGTALLLNDDPDALRQRIDRFINALDAHLTDV